MKFRFRFFQQGRGRARQLVALVLFFADGEQPHARLGPPQDDARIDLAHHRELRQHLGRAIHVGAHVHQHHRRSAGGGQDAHQRGPVHARHHALHHLGGGHHRAGVAGRDQPLRRSVAHQARRHPDGAVPLGAESLGGAVLHGDHVAGVHHLDGKVAVVFVFLEFRLDHFLPAHQDDLDPQVPGGADRPLHFGFGGVIPAHCIYRNGQHVATPVLLLRHFDHFAALVLAAVRAHPVGQLGLMAIGTLGSARRLQRIVRAAGARPPLGVSAFRIRHISTSANLIRGCGVNPGTTQSSSLRSAPQRSSKLSTLQSHAVSFRFLPQTGQIPLQTSLQTRCMGKASSTCSRRMSSRSRPPPS